MKYQRQHPSINVTALRSTRFHTQHSSFYQCLDSTESETFIKRRWVNPRYYQSWGLPVIFTKNMSFVWVCLVPRLRLMCSKARNKKKTGVKEHHSRVTGKSKEKEFSRGNERNISHFQLFSYRNPPQTLFIFPLPL